MSLRQWTCGEFEVRSGWNTLTRAFWLEVMEPAFPITVFYRDTEPRSISPAWDLRVLLLEVEREGYMLPEGLEQHLLEDMTFNLRAVERRYPATVYRPPVRRNNSAGDILRPRSEPCPTD